MASATAIPIVKHTLERQAAGRQHVRQRPSVHQLHREEDGRARVLHRMDGDDVRVVERGDGERLARESLAAIGIGRGDIGQDLQRDLAPEPQIARPIDFAHPADAEQRHDFVRTEPGARVKRDMVLDSAMKPARRREASRRCRI